MRPEQKVLPIFKDVVLSREDRARLRRIMDNWLTIHAHIVETEKRVGEMGAKWVRDELAKMLLLEITDNGTRRKPRYNVWTRLHTRLCKWRKRIERHEIYTWSERERG